MSKNTFIANNDGTKYGFIPGKCLIARVPNGCEIKYCTCDIDTTHIDDIADWSTGINLDARSLWVAYSAAVDSASTVAQLKATKSQLKDILLAIVPQDMS